MTVETPPEFIAEVVRLLKTRWHSGRKSFQVSEIEILTGKLCHISDTAPWLRFLMSQLYTSIAAALGANNAHLISTNKAYREAIKTAKLKPSQDTPAIHISFAQSTSASRVHKCKQVHFLNKTLKRELQFILKVLSDPSISKKRPIAHLVARDHDSEGHSDSSLKAGGGFSIQMCFWWYIEWPECIQKHTLIYIKNSKSGDLISINALEYASLLINFAAATHYWVFRQKCLDSRSNSYPVVLLWADNTTAESWMTKGCKESAAGRALGLLQCAMMLNNPVGTNTGHIDTKSNVIADRISRFKKETNSLIDFNILLQDYPQLRSCQRFHPSAGLISLITEALLHKKCADPVAVNRLILSDPGRIIT